MSEKQKADGKNILMLTTFYYPSKGGIQTYTKKITENLIKLGNNVTTFAIASNGVTNLTTSTWLKLYNNNEKIAWFHLCKKYDDIFVSSWFPAGILGIFIKRLQHIPLFIAAHGNEILYPKKYPFMRYLMRCCFKHADKIFAVSNYTKQLLVKEHINAEKIIVVPNGTNPIRFNPDVNYDEIIKEKQLLDKKIIFSVSRLVERKNFGIVIESLIEILKEIPNAVYVIGGKGPMQAQWAQLALELGVEDRVIFVGYISDEDLPKFYAMSDVFVLPSIGLEEKADVEGFGIAFLEANASSVPVVGGRSGGVEDAIVDGKTGFLVNPTDKKEIQAAIINILKHPKLAQSMGTYGRKRVVEQLSWNKVTKKIWTNMQKESEK